MQRPALPDFGKPPVTEVALSVQFEELANFRAIHLGLLWEFLGIESFPKFEEHPPVPSSIETFTSADIEQSPKFEFLETPPMPRYLFVSQGGTIVVQVQQDRFTVNWRKRTLEDEYPRFEFLQETFERHFERFQDFLRVRSLGKIVVSQVEVTYVNRIALTDEMKRLQEVCSMFSGRYSDTFLEEPEETFVSFRFPIRRNDVQVGRLYVDIRPEQGVKSTALRMVLVARGKPDGNDLQAAKKFLLLGREYIVSGFASITSPEAHTLWERKDNA